VPLASGAGRTDLSKADQIVPAVLNNATAQTQPHLL